MLSPLTRGSDCHGPGEFKHSTNEVLDTAASYVEQEGATVQQSNSAADATMSEGSRTTGERGVNSEAQPKRLSYLNNHSDDQPGSSVSRLEEEGIRVIHDGEQTDAVFRPAPPAWEQV